MSYTWQKDKQKENSLRSVILAQYLHSNSLWSYIFNKWVMDKMQNAQPHNVGADVKADKRRKKKGFNSTKSDFAPHNRICHNSTAAFLKRKHAHNVPWQHKSSFCCCYFDCLANPPLVFKAFFPPSNRCKTSQLNTSKRRMHLRINHCKW